MISTDTYIENIIRKGDEGSALLAARAAPTLKNSPYVEIVDDSMNGLSVLRLPKKSCVVVHSAGGNPLEYNPIRYAASAVDNLELHSTMLDVKPLAFANVIDSSTGDSYVLSQLMEGFVQKANEYRLAIMNGENAILGQRVRPANVSCTMIGLGHPDLLQGQKIIVGKKHGIAYAAFDHEEQPVWINSDGVGTKLEFGERSRNYAVHLDDSVAMKADDTIKKGARLKVISDVVETGGAIPVYTLQARADSFYQRHGIAYILQYEYVGERIQSYRPDIPAYNISGSAVSTLDEHFLKNPPVPHAGEVLVAITGTPNPRSNGITDKRRIMTERFGEEWHTTEEGKHFLEYLARPSTILYFVFQDLLDQGLASSFYHMSGGAYHGKLAVPLVKHHLAVQIVNLFPPDPRELFFVEQLGGIKNAYAKWPMGNDGFISTNDPSQAESLIRKHGLNARPVGVLKNAFELTACNGEIITFP